MKMMLRNTYIGLFFLVICYSGFGQSESSFIKFKIKNAGLYTNGYFSQYNFDLYYNKANPQQSKFNGTLRASSINTGVTMRDNHLRSKEYFNVLEFPEIIFISSNINVISSNELNVSGTLNIKGISKKVNFNVKVSSGINKDVLNATLVLNRFDFGIGKSSWTLSDVVSLNLRYTQENK